MGKMSQTDGHVRHKQVVGRAEPQPTVAHAWLIQVIIPIGPAELKAWDYYLAIGPYGIAGWVVKWIRYLGQKQSSVDFGSVSVLMDVMFGRQVHCVGVKVGRCQDVFVGSSLLNVYYKCGEMWDALKVFDEMPKRNSFTWAMLISVLGFNN
ncbi:pentatricopeptide repeat-containing protein [Tanacetum coccineum]